MKHATFQVDFQILPNTCASSVLLVFLNYHLEQNHFQKIYEVFLIKIKTGYSLRAEVWQLLVLP